MKICCCVNTEEDVETPALELSMRFQFVIIELLSDRKDSCPPCPLEVVTDGDLFFHPIPTRGQRMMHTRPDTHAHREKSSGRYRDYSPLRRRETFSLRMLQYH